MLAVETEAVISRIWLMTSEKRSTTELTWVARSPSSSPRLTLRAVVELALVKLPGDLDDLEQGPDEPAAEEPAEDDRQRRRTPRMSQIVNSGSCRSWRRRHLVGTTTR